MPEAGRFIASFGLRKIATSGGWSMSILKKDHIVVQLYRRYSYNFKIKLTPTRANPTNVIPQLRAACAKPRRVKSGYGNPYECRITSFKTESGPNGSIVLNLTGKSVRVYD